MTILEILNGIQSHFNENRQVGHTTTMQMGTRNVQGTVVITANQDQADRMKQENQFAFGGTGGKHSPLESFAKGTVPGKCPVVFDNYAIMMLAGQAAAEITELRRRVAQANARLKQIQQFANLEV